MQPRVLVVGPVSWNLIIGLDALPAPVPHMEFVRSSHWTVGGTSAGKALNLRSLGVAVTLSTVVGDDNLAERVLGELRGQGVDVIAEQASLGQTEQHLNLMDRSGGRVSLYLHVPRLAEGDIRYESETRAAVRSADAVVVDLSEPSRTALSEARQAGRPIWCDLHDYDGRSSWHRAFIDAASYLFLNDDKIGDPEPFMRARIAAGAELVVVTRGAAGALAMAGDGVLHSVAAERVEQIVDTNGAGDAFFAGYLAAHLASDPIDGCLAAAAHQAALCIQSPHLAPL